MRVTWVWANSPDDESGTERPVQRGRNARRTSRSSKPSQPPRHHSERNTDHV
jgi:hypothetical protein